MSPEYSKIYPDECESLLSHDDYARAKDSKTWRGTDALVFDVLCKKCKYRLIKMARGCRVITGHDEEGRPITQNLKFEPIEEA